MSELGLNDVLDAYDAFDTPVVAALHGTALGGGLEVALTSHWRLAAPSARVGLPEVQPSACSRVAVPVEWFKDQILTRHVILSRQVHLGLLPGAGGTQRLPRIVGMEAACEIMVSGRMLSMKEALERGIIDSLVEVRSHD